MIALIDGDIVAYQAATAATKDIDWGDGQGPQPVVDIPSSIDTACRIVDEWTRLAGAKTPTVCFSSRTGTNFRKHLDPTYKMGRPDKPIAYWEIVDAIEARFKWWRVEGLEADDVMGIAATSERYGDTVIVSLDKDMNTIPGRVFNPNKDARPRRINMTVADHFWMTQTLTGDPVDGYKGCPKIGPVKAAKILAESYLQLGAMWPAVVEAFEASGLPESHALLQARLARILRSSDYDRVTKEIQLWHLKKPEPFALSAIGSSPAPVAPSSPVTAPTPVATTPRVVKRPARSSKSSASTPTRTTGTR